MYYLILSRKSFNSSLGKSNMRDYNQSQESQNSDPVASLFYDWQIIPFKKAFNLSYVWLQKEYNEHYWKHQVADNEADIRSDKAN